MPPEKGPKKQISDRRRSQNKQAQKNYRKANGAAVAESVMLTLWV
jgi:hypothetical protein